MKIVFDPTKETKNTYKFEEVRESELDPFFIGQLYIQKPTLGQLGWTPGDQIEVELSVVG